MFDKFKIGINETIKTLYWFLKRIYHVFRRSYLNIKTFIRIQSKRLKALDKKRKIWSRFKVIFWRVLPYFLGWLVWVAQWIYSGAYYTRCFI